MPDNNSDRDVFISFTPEALAGYWTALSYAVAALSKLNPPERNAQVLLEMASAQVSYLQENGHLPPVDAALALGLHERLVANVGSWLEYLDEH